MGQGVAEAPGASIPSLKRLDEADSGADARSREEGGTQVAEGPAAKKGSGKDKDLYG